MKSNEGQDREAVKTAFTERYNEAGNSNDSYRIVNEILALVQEIQDYLQSVERFSKRVPDKY